jgi:hypothetical protein
MSATRLLADAIADRTALHIDACELLIALGRIAGGS